MEQKAKRVGKFNIIDIIAVILIVAVVAFGAWKLLGSSGGTAAEDGGMVKVTYVVKCEGVPTELYETCQAHLPSPLMASGALVGGQIESVEMEPYYVLGPDGQWIEDPEHVTLLFTATTETPAGEVMTTKVGTHSSFTSMGCPPAEGAYLHAFQASRFSMLAGISPLRACRMLLGKRNPVFRAVSRRQDPLLCTARGLR